ncbi:protein FAM98A [Megalops cyprinoides]|uniref:protein FAM98A n=1 Tax=Megalops cyprinoides TaxID=118141 RepID=UPI0018651DD3|nr:protein FAM98A [Megalops cyprinoides]
MARDSRTVSSLIALGYPGSACLKKCDCDELPCPLLSWLVSELRTVCPAVQEGERKDPAVSAVLVGELRALLKELRCPCAALTTETLTAALLNRLTEFLVSELQAARILLYRELHPEDRAKGGDTEKEQRESGDRGVDLVEENQERGGYGGVGDREGERDKTKEITQLLQALDLDPSSQLTDIYTEVESRLALLPGGAMPEPLLERALNAEQWRCLQQINQALAQDYECRRNMMIKRFQVTLQSFTWGEKGQERSAVLASMPPLSPLTLSSHVSLSLLLAARQDQSRILPVRAGPSTAIHKVMMGGVPDRGGRPGEIEPPMPMWERRREGGGRGGRDRGRQQRGNHSGRKKKNKKKE